MTTPAYLGEFEHLLLLAVLQLGDTAFGADIARELEQRAGRRPLRREAQEERVGLVGLAAGFYARKVNSTGKGIAVASAVALVLAFAVAAMPSETGEHYYLQIMLPGFITGAMIGFFTQRYGAPAKQS